MCKQFINSFINSSPNVVQLGSEKQRNGGQRVWMRMKKFNERNMETKDKREMAMWGGCRGNAV